MKCPACGSSQIGTRKTTPTDDAQVRHRQCRALGCGFEWQTVEKSNEADLARAREIRRERTRQSIAHLPHAHTAA